MPAFGYIALVDADAQRRSAVRKTLLTEHIHVEPFENVAELAVHWPRAAVILVHNDNGAIPALAEQMAERGSWVPILGYSESPAPNQVVEAVFDGAVGYLRWPFIHRDVSAAFANTAERFAGWVEARQKVTVARLRLKRLTPREREVLAGVATGLSNREIGLRLGISPRTVEIHRSHALDKIGVSHTSEAVRFAIEAEIIE